ncbi:iron-regulated transporter [Penicillium capsulatum]|uniref:Solute carrier family 40 member n=1 Tax=Penicillium capsulatum TaxID=69766 RepID=A0A9W9HKY6_9EURO|nr:iron-regulated transporter [Penicillium capsulatum]
MAKYLERTSPDEDTPLIAQAETGVIPDSRLHDHEAHDQDALDPGIAYRLYFSHFLSTWNSRVFQFGAVLYLATLYPGTLLPMSIYALSRGLAGIIFAPAVGYYVDVGDRLQVVRVSIVFQRVPVAVSCMIFYVLAIGLDVPKLVDNLLLAALALLACIEKLCSVMNLVSVERDWVVVVAGNNKKSLKVLNAQMRRIDLICQLIGPLFIALFNDMSTKTAILANLAMNVLSVVVEYFSIAQMVTWLLSAGYDSTQIVIARTMSVAFEVLATWIAPWLMGKIGTIRAGIWLANWQIACLACGTVIFWKFADDPLISASGLVGSTIVSRIGLRGFDLCAQILVQEGVEPEVRGSFSSIEAAWQSVFEIGSYSSTIFFSRPDQFKWPALISIIAVGVAGFLYTVFVRLQRGHLVHFPKFLLRERQGLSRERGLESILSSSSI